MKTTDTTKHAGADHKGECKLCANTATASQTSVVGEGGADQLVEKGAGTVSGDNKQRLSHTACKQRRVEARNANEMHMHIHAVRCMCMACTCICTNAHACRKQTQVPPLHPAHAHAHAYMHMQHAHAYLHACASLSLMWVFVRPATPHASWILLPTAADLTAKARDEASAAVNKELSFKEQRRRR